MVRYQYIGKIGPYTGKRLFEILANLKNNGKGRIVQRLSELKRNKSGKEQFYKIVKAVPQMDLPDLAFGQAWAEQVKDGKKVPFLVKLKTTIPDYQLVLKIDESKFDKEYPIYGTTEEDTMHLKEKYKLPPVLAEFLNKHHSQNDLGLLKYGLDRSIDGYDSKSVTDFEIPFVYELDEYQKLCKIVYDDEAPK